MLKFKWTCAFLILGLLFVMQSFAGSHDIAGSMVDKGMGDLFELAMYYEEQAQADKSKAENWDFMADYYPRRAHIPSVTFLGENVAWDPLTRS